VPEVDLDRVERRWKALQAENPRYFDGDILHVLGHSRNGHGGVTIHVAPTSYRFYAVERPGRDVHGGEPIDCGVRPLGAKAFTMVDGRLAMARRSRSVAFYPGEWEFVPGGGLEVDDDPARAVLRELAEETPYEAIAPPVAIAFLYDPGALSWEVIHRIEARPRAERANDAHAWEHADRALVEPGRWPEPLCAVARAMLGLREA
jgi:8-oxo-dGTP pyrophosphatase MutT (NUDIX family)